MAASATTRCAAFASSLASRRAAPLTRSSTSAASSRSRASRSARSSTRTRRRSTGPSARGRRPPCGEFVAEFRKQRFHARVTFSPGVQGRRPLGGRDMHVEHRRLRLSPHRRRKPLRRLEEGRRAARDVGAPLASKRCFASARHTTERTSSRCSARPLRPRRRPARLRIQDVGQETGCDRIRVGNRGGPSVNASRTLWTFAQIHSGSA